MCGIYGIVGPRIDQEKVMRATHTLAHRGPDETGFFFGETVGLGHHRLSVIDLSTGRQPIFNEDGSKCIVHNGEIYNFMEVRELLQAKGHVFGSRGDSETILHAYEEWGEACVEHLRGMFAFAIWDERSKTLFLARDRLGG